MRISKIVSGVLAAGAAAAALAMPAMALEELKDEKDRLKACETQLCTVVTKKAPRSGPFTCHLTKTWHRDKLKESSQAGNISWGFGDARCTVSLKLDNAAVVGAVSPGEYTLQFPDHTVECLVEREKEPTTVKLTLAPKATFKDGKAEKIWIGLKEVDGPGPLKALAYSAAKLEDTVGLAQKYLVGAVNNLVSEKCPKVAAGG